MPIMQLVVAALRAALDLVLPAQCGGCGTLGFAWCDDCQRSMIAAGFPGGARLVVPSPCPGAFPPTYAASPYQGPVRQALVAFKDRERADLAVVLAPLLAGALVRCLSPPGGQGVLLVPVPSSRAAVRRRGRRPLVDLLRRAVQLADGGPGGPRLVVAPALRVRRRVADQAGLGTAGRADNLDHAFGLHPRWAARVDGATCVVVDDVVTTGATLVEAARVLRYHRARSIRAAAVAATQRQHR
ncbi:MAG TPA: phosphoribosyltransferase family protein [Dermatophilaceae bacterium]|nr:phosphoribosyltransferase family protein [Dermatophilaceae bacterium]